MDPANASVVAKIVTRLNDLGISDAGMAMADADAVRSRALSLLAQKLVAKVPEKVCSLLSGLHAESPLRRIKLQRMLRPLQLTAVVPRLLQAVSVAQMQGHLMLHRQDPFAAVLTADFSTHTGAVAAEEPANETQATTEFTEAASSPGVQTPPAAGERRKTKVL